ncbi:radical SAM protein [Nocardia cyriacigeorgica]|uniref:Radical SAM protein n=2 Tax=Nocardiaceae TaxID=85025 RepID=A0A5R8P879_9NOCA|nr:radical SAM protein [Nocardia cyriacigeorgica]
MRVMILYPPVLPFGYTLHHRFQRLWEAGAYVRIRYPSTTIVDAGLMNMLKGQVLNEYATGYDAVAVYAEPQMLQDVADFVDRFNHMDSRTRIMLYGPAVVCFPALARALPVDAVGCRGDYEAQLRQFVDWASGGMVRVSNLAIRSGSQWIEPTDTPELVGEVDWAYPPLDEMPMADIARIYTMKGQPTTVAVTASRGCPYRCTFCATPELEGRPDRRRNPEALAQYIEQNQQHSHWQLYSPTFTLDRHWCMEFFKQLDRRQVAINWRCTTRVDRLDPQLTEAMAASGCSMVGLGIETLGPALLSIKKGIGQPDMARAIRMLVASGIAVKAYIMLGLPGQRLQDVRRTIDFVHDLGAEIRPTMYSPQGSADGLPDAAAGLGGDDVSAIDRKSFLQDREHYGEYLRLVFSRSSRQLPS